VLIKAETLRLKNRGKIAVFLLSSLIFLKIIKLEGGNVVKRTPLYQEHLKLGGNMVDFGGWEMPVQYTSIIEEHEKARTSAALFDVSHMGEIEVKGEGAQDFLQKMLTNKIEFSSDYQIIYSPMCNPDGGVVDDLLEVVGKIVSKVWRRHSWLCGGNPLGFSTSYP
jgi:hypothetical protein